MANQTATNWVKMRKTKRIRIIWISLTTCQLKEKHKAWLTTQQRFQDPSALTLWGWRKFSGCMEALIHESTNFTSQLKPETRDFMTAHEFNWNYNFHSPMKTLLIFKLEQSLYFWPLHFDTIRLQDWGKPPTKWRPPTPAVRVPTGTPPIRSGLYCPSPWIQAGLLPCFPQRIGRKWHSASLALKRATSVCLYSMNSEPLCKGAQLSSQDTS